MKVSDWHVMIDEDGHHYFYGDLDDFSEDDLKGLTELPQEKWTSYDWTEIIGSLLEDANKHSVVNCPAVILHILEDAGCEEPMRVSVMQRYADYIEREIC